jgi:DNA-binding transcriptional regulator YdaS (Cro superfamily)
MFTHSETILMLGGSADLADALGVPKVRVDRWAARDRIPPEYWPSIESVARDRSVNGVTVGALLVSHRPRKPAGREAVS